MHCKKARLIINPRAGENLTKLTDINAVLAAAGWKTAVDLKEYGGQAVELATEAAEDDYDLVIAYGGDGMVNQVINGVMNAKGQHSTVGIIPGGTANVWADEVGIPNDPVKAALTLINSEVRKVDIGHVEVESLTFADETQNDGNHTGSQTNGRGKKSRKAKATSAARHHFLLMAGLGIDAAVMQHVSKPLKYHIGPLAVGFSAARELPKQHPFPVEIRAAGDKDTGDLVWRGEAIQVIIGNTRKYADIVEMTPNAYIDDGILDVCVITAGDPLSTLQQITMLLLRRRPDNLTAEYFHGAHLSISAPASINLQLDGSAVKLKDYLSKSDRKALKKAGDAEHVMVNYRFDAMSQALHIAIPSTYNDTLFEHTDGKGVSHPELSQQAHEEQTGDDSHDQSGTRQSQDEEQLALAAENTPENNGRHSEEEQKELTERVSKLMGQGRKVAVVGASPNPDKKETYIIAGGAHKQSTGETKPVAVRVNGNTTVLRQTGEPASPAVVQKLQEGSEIVVEGKKRKRGVIAAKRVVV